MKAWLLRHVAKHQLSNLAEPDDNIQMDHCAFIYIINPLILPKNQPFGFSYFVAFNCSTNIFFSLWRNNREKSWQKYYALGSSLHFSHLFEIFQSGTHKGTFLVVVLYYHQSPFFPKNFSRQRKLKSDHFSKRFPGLK